jgi:hypothetical protein
MSWEAVSGDRAMIFKSQIVREVSSGHALFHILDRIAVVARDDASDDVLAIDQENAEEAHVVHLTWQTAPSLTSEWPHTQTLRMSEIEKTLGVIVRRDPTSLPQARK